MIGRTILRKHFLNIHTSLKYFCFTSLKQCSSRMAQITTCSKESSEVQILNNRFYAWMVAAKGRKHHFNPFTAKEDLSLSHSWDGNTTKERIMAIWQKIRCCQWCLCHCQVKVGIWPAGILSLKQNNTFFPRQNAAEHYWAVFQLFPDLRVPKHSFRSRGLFTFGLKTEMRPKAFGKLNPNAHPLKMIKKILC